MRYFSQNGLPQHNQASPGAAVYTSSVLALAAQDSSASFNLIEAAAGGHTVFRVDGLGDVYLGVGGAVRISAARRTVARAAIVARSSCVP